LCIAHVVSLLGRFWVVEGGWGQFFERRGREGFAKSAEKYKKKAKKEKRKKKKEN
jgi:hypothetical protein